MGDDELSSLHHEKCVKLIILIEFNEPNQVDVMVVVLEGILGIWHLDLIACQNTLVSCLKLDK